MNADVAIIGAGVVGCAIARELSRYDRKVVVLEKASDVCEGTSKANSGIVHSGYDAKPGTMKAQMNLQGNAMMEDLARELDFPFKRNGSLVLCFDENDRETLNALLQRGQENQVPGLRIVEREELLTMEPSLGDQVVAALYAPTGGIVCPFNLTIALAENAAVNGAEFVFGADVTKIEKAENTKEHGYWIETSRGNYHADYVINAAGVYADVFHNMVSEKKLHIIPRKGEYLLFDKKVGQMVNATLFQLPTAMGKGILVTPTVHGNLLMGPTAEDVEDPEETKTTAEGLQNVQEKAALSIKQIPFKSVITSFAGLRAHKEGGDFVIGEVPDAPGFIDAAGIESPGLTSAPAIGVYVAKLLQKMAPAQEKVDFVAGREGIPCMALLPDSEKKALIAKDPAYANVICRCEMVTEGEIMNAIHRPLGATTVDGIKRRTRAGMGRCQAGFCAPKTVEILARELGVDMEQITKAGGESIYLSGHNKEKAI